MRTCTHVVYSGFGSSHEETKPPLSFGPNDGGCMVYFHLTTAALTGNDPDGKVHVGR